MLLAFLESIKHVGHLYPLALLRIFVGYVYLSNALDRLHGAFLEQPRIAAMIMETVPSRELFPWYQKLLEDVIVPNWQVFAYSLVYLEFLVGMSFIIGFLVRPAALIGMFLTLNGIFIVASSQVPLQQIYLTLFVVLYWVGAGRSLGIDYYFYKRQRGLWW